MRNAITYAALYRKQNREMKTYGLPNALIKGDPSGPYVSFNASKVYKVH